MDSKLQIISGTYRGRRLHLPDGARPTQNRARVALFNILGGLIDASRDFTVWDAFGGSGAFGIEMLSRYPGARAVFTDVATNSIQTIKKNLAGLCDNRATVVQSDARDAIARFAGDADVIFVDPPYVLGDVGADFVRKCADVVRAGTILIWEQDAIGAALPDGDVWEILRDRRYGRARFLFLRRRDG